MELKTRGYELFVSEDYQKNKILLTAEHAAIEYIKIGNGIVEVGDFGTGEICRYSAEKVGGASLVARIPRSEVDFNRKLEDLGKELFLQTSIYTPDLKSKVGSVRIRIHKNRGLNEVWSEYHAVPSILNPKIIISIHGMAEKPERPEVCISVGREYEFLEKSLAEKLRIELKNALKYLDIYEISINEPFSHSCNPMLRRNVYEFNKKMGKILRKGFGVELIESVRKEVGDKRKVSERGKLAGKIIAETSLSVLTKK